MREIIDWLRGIELLASRVYLEASRQLAEDQEFSSFLSRMSEDEAWHYHIIGSASLYFLEGNEYPKSVIMVDIDTRNEIETSFNELIDSMARSKITRKGVLDCMIKAEFSELNSIFLYVVKTLAEASPSFQHVSASIEAHKTRITKFLEELPVELKVPKETYELPQLWDKRILLVEDEDNSREIFSETLKKVGGVMAVADGEEALEALEKNFYNAVITDIQMPGMSGIDLYQKALQVNPEINRKFLFISGELTPAIQSFLMKNHLACLEKPFSLKRLTRTVGEIIDKTL